MRLPLTLLLLFGAAHAAPTSQSTTQPAGAEALLDHAEAAAKARLAPPPLFPSFDEERFQGMGELKGPLKPSSASLSPNVARKRLYALGGCPKAAVAARLDEIYPQLMACYRAALQKNPLLSTHVRLSFNVAEGGAVWGAQAEGSAPLGRCLIDLTAGWSLPNPAGGTCQVGATYAFELRFQRGG